MERDFLESNSSKETYEIGFRLGREAQAGDVICLEGELGTGKTVFSQGFAAGMGIDEIINSPTFTILKEYHEGRLPLYHFDVYRIGSDDEMDEIGYYDKIDGDGVCLIEWPSIIRDILPEHFTKIIIEKNTDFGFNYRKIIIDKK